MTEELKPCGNCNAPARWVENAWRIKCTRQSCGVVGGKFATRHEAIAVWNQRATIANTEALREVVEALESAALESAALALPVLVTMLKAARLGKGADIAIKTEAEIRATLAKLGRG